MVEIPWKSLTVLVADDEPAQLRLYAHAVKLLGVKKVLTAADGADALSQINMMNGRVHIVITDVDMPTVNGLEFVKKLRAHPDSKTAAIPVIVVTSHRDSAIVREAATLGIQGFLAKPISEAMLKSRMTKALQRSV